PVIEIDHDDAPFRSGGKTDILSRQRIDDADNTAKSFYERFQGIPVRDDPACTTGGRAKI
ncbi:MAG TPA: hypothetical protein PLD53_11435, partial [Candidatus Propionivibrio aalborgensis]|nr:hypothetical protein [Candidatus Propionivibrio aalborgensis]